MIKLGFPIIYMSPLDSRSSHRDGFSKYLFFFPGATFLQFSRRVYLFVGQTCFFQEGLSVRRTDMFFPGGSICSLNGHKFSRRVYQTDMFFEEGSIRSSNRYILTPEAFIFSSNIYSFSRKPYLVLEHIFFSRIPLCLKQIGVF